MASSTPRGRANWRRPMSNFSTRCGAGDHRQEFLPSGASRVRRQGDLARLPKIELFTVDKLLGAGRNAEKTLRRRRRFRRESKSKSRPSEPHSAIERTGPGRERWASKSLALHGADVLPGFSLTFGYTLVYLSLIVLFPLSVLVWRASGLGFGAFTPRDRAARRRPACAHLLDLASGGGDRRGVRPHRRLGVDSIRVSGPPLPRRRGRSAFALRRRSPAFRSPRSMRPTACSARRWRRSDQGGVHAPWNSGGADLRWSAFHRAQVQPIIGNRVELEEASRRWARRARRPSARAAAALARLF